ncbi:deaminase [Opitutaceae bacterium EW11]|nr:deaminase [Opitutaceae bacterium EW11]
MRKLRIFEHISLDGVVEHEGDYAYGAWTAPYRSPEGLKAVLGAQGPRFDLLLGRRTYDAWSAYWPNAGRSPMADALNSATKYVATHRPDSLEWGPANGLGSDVIEGVRRLKSEEGPDLIIWGSSTVTSPLLDRGLVDELVLIIYPVLLGRGKRVLSDSASARAFALVDTKGTPTGLLINTYRHVGSLRA